MASKKVIVKETAASAKAARVAKPATPRVPSARHSKSKAVDSNVEVPAPVAASQVSQEVIARTAYGYWQARGCTHGDALQDWLRAENEVRSVRTAAATA